LSEPDPLNGENDDSWKKPVILMLAFTAIPVVIIAIAFAVHSFS
jgi:hypothetical protein